MEEAGCSECITFFFSLLFLTPVSIGSKEERGPHCCQTTSAPEDGGWSFDDDWPASIPVLTDGCYSLSRWFVLNLALT